MTEFILLATIMLLIFVVATREEMRQRAATKNWCAHGDVDVLYVKPVTLEPADALCNDCGKKVTREWVSKT